MKVRYLEWIKKHNIQRIYFLTHKDLKTFQKNNDVDAVFNDLINEDAEIRINTTKHLLNNHNGIHKITIENTDAFDD